MRNNYFELLSQVKFDIEYYKLFYQKYTNIERGIGIVFAAVSTGSLAGFFACETGKSVYAVILVVIQVANAVKPYLPFANRAKELDRLLIKMEYLFAEIENGWSDIEKDKLDEQQMQSMINTFKKRRTELQMEYLPDDILPTDEKITQKADKNANEYLKINYGAEI